MKRETKIVKCAICGLTLISMLALVYYILKFAILYFSSDGAAIVLLAREQIEKRQFVPDGFCYSTGIFIVTPGLLIIPLMLFIKDWLLCRKIAVILFVMLIFFLIFKFYKKIGEDWKKSYAPFIAIILMCLPMGHYQETYYEAGYAVLLLAELSIMLFLFEVISEQKSKTKKLFSLIGLFISILIFNMGFLHSQAITMIPIIVTILLYAFIEYCRCGEVVLRSKKVSIALGVLISGTGLAFILYKLLVEKVGLYGTTGGIFFSDTISENIYTFLGKLLSFYNAISSCELLSLRGILNCVNFVIFVIAAIIVPILSIVMYGKIENKFLRIYVIYTWISDFIVMYMILFTTAISAADRYYETIFFHKILLMALLINYLLKHKMQIVRVGLLSAMFVTVFLSHVVYMQLCTEKKQAYVANNEGTICDYLKDNNLTHGYATFWNAYENTVLSNGEVTIAGVLPGGNTPYYWLTSREWYDAEQYPGRSFLLLAEGETTHKQLFEQASEIKYFQGYTILIFEENLLTYQLTEDIETTEITIERLSVDNNAYVYSNEIYLKNGGAQYGPYISLDKGSYEVTISGTNVDELTTNVTMNRGIDEIPCQVIESSSNQMVISFNLQEPIEGIEIKNINMEADVVTITGMQIERQP